MIQKKTKESWFITSPLRGGTIECSSLEEAERTLKRLESIAALPKQETSYAFIEKYYDYYRVLSVNDSLCVIDEDMEFYGLYEVRLGAIYKIKREAVYAIGDAEVSFLKACSRICDKYKMSLPITKPRLIENRLEIYKVVYDMKKTIEDSLKDFVNEFKGI